MEAEWNRQGKDFFRVNAGVLVDIAECVTHWEDAGYGQCRPGLNERFNPSTLHRIFAFSSTPDMFSENMKSFFAFLMLCSNRLT